MSTLETLDSQETLETYSITFEQMILYKDYICLDIFKHMKDTCMPPGNDLDVLSTQKYPQFDFSHTSEWQFVQKLC